MTIVRRSLIVLAALLATSPARAWNVEVRGSVSGPGAAQAIATAADGDVIAAGVFQADAQGTRFVVVRLAAADGAERWRTIIPDAPASQLAMTLDADGDVLIATGGQHEPPASAPVFKLAGATGAIRWRRDLQGLPIAIRTDDANAVYVATNPLTVVQLAPDTGNPTWTFQQDGDAIDLAIIQGQDPVLLTFKDVIRLDRSTGVPVWAQTLMSLQGELTRVATAGDDVFVGGWVVGTAPGGGLITTGIAFALSATTGDVRWTSAPLTPLASVRALAPTPAGDVAVAGPDLDAGATNPSYFAVTTPHALVLAHADGAVVSDVVIPAKIPPCQSALCGGAVTSLVADPSGDLWIVGSFTPSDVVAARLAAPDLHIVWRRDGGDFPSIPGHFLARGAAAGKAGALVVAGVRRMAADRDAVGTFTVLSFDATGAIRACGDDVVDPGEACDDGDVVDGNDCCAPDCSSARRNGSACSDDSLCTIDDRCVDGRCQGGAPLPCEPCGVCHSATGCFLDSLGVICAASTISDGARVGVVNPRRGPDRFSWSLRSGPAAAKTDFGNPLEDTSYAICGARSDGQILFRATAPPGKCRGRRRCWRSTRAGFEYTDPSAADGMTRLSLHAGGGGMTRIRAAGAKRRALVGGLPLPADEKLFVVLRRMDDPSVCWSSELETVTKNGARKFRATGR
jgi:outer membrane protein assembly factor BamB